MPHRSGLPFHLLPGDEVLDDQFAADGLRGRRVESHYRPHPWSEFRPLSKNTWGFALVVDGAYRRRLTSGEHVVDANTGFLRRPGEEVAVAHFTDEPDALTIVDVDEGILDLYPELTTAAGPFHITPAMALHHHRLLVDLAGGAAPWTVQARITELIEAIGRLATGTDRTYGRATTGPAHQRLVAHACEVLHGARGDIGLVELARQVGASPFHLSRVFRQLTGSTLTRCRLRLRAHDALGQIVHGDDDLTSIASAAGFADHSHMTRTMVATFGEPPSASCVAWHPTPTARCRLRSS